LTVNYHKNIVRIITKILILTATMTPLVGVWAVMGIIKHLGEIVKVVHLGVGCRYLTEKGDPDFEKSRPLSVMLGETGMYYTVPTGTGDYREYTEMFTGGN
jgi:hypothetical protein